jgi:hypothetical protein
MTIVDQFLLRLDRKMQVQLNQIAIRVEIAIEASGAVIILNSKILLIIDLKTVDMCTNVTFIATQDPDETTAFRPAGMTPGIGRLGTTAVIERTATTNDIAHIETTRTVRDSAHIEMTNYGHLLVLRIVKWEISQRLIF